MGVIGFRDLQGHLTQFCTESRQLFWRSVLRWPLRGIGQSVWFKVGDNREVGIVDPLSARVCE